MLEPLADEDVALSKELLPGKVSTFGRYAKARHLGLFACTYIRFKELRGKERIFVRNCGLSGSSAIEGKDSNWRRHIAQWCLKLDYIQSGDGDTKYAASSWMIY